MRHVILGVGLLLVAIVAHAANGGEWRNVLDPEWEADPSQRAAGIYYGEVTTAYPAVAKLLIGHSRGTGLCSGTLIAPSIVLTAAHCVPDNLVGVNAVFSDGVTVTSYKAVSYAIHPGFTWLSWPRADIAVLALASPVIGVDPLAVAVAAPPPRSHGSIVGFGEDRARLVGIKRVGSVRLRRCPRRPFPRIGVAAGGLDQSLCWRPRRLHADTCYGDSGGPLIVDGIVVGVTSGGYPGCHGRLSWDANVALFRDWIDAKLVEALQ